MMTELHWGDRVTVEFDATVTQVKDGWVRTLMPDGNIHWVPVSTVHPKEEE